MNAPDQDEGIYHQLLKSIAEGAFLEKHRFPSIRRMIAQRQISRRQVERVLRRLHSDGLLQIRRRLPSVLVSGANRKAGELLEKNKSTNLRSGSPPISANDVAGHRGFLSERLTQALLLELASGRYRYGARFLSNDRITQMWRVSRPTIDKARAFLVSHRLIRRRNATLYEVCRDAANRASILLEKLQVPALGPPVYWELQRNRLVGDGSTQSLRLALLTEKPLALPLEHLPGPTNKYTLAQQIQVARKYPYIMVLRRTLKKHHASLSLLHIDSSHDEEEVVNMLKKHGISGLMVPQWNDDVRKTRIVARLQKENFPVLRITDNYEGETQFSVDFNEASAGYNAMKTLLHHGHRNILLVGTPNRWVGNRRRFGALRCLTDLGMDRQVRLWRRLVKNERDLIKKMPPDS